MYDACAHRNAHTHTRLQTLPHHTHLHARTNTYTHSHIPPPPQLAIYTLVCFHSRGQRLRSLMSFIHPSYEFASIPPVRLSIRHAFDHSVQSLDNTPLSSVHPSINNLTSTAVHPSICSSVSLSVVYMSMISSSPQASLCLLLCLFHSSLRPFTRAYELGFSFASHRLHDV